jgi:HKD family nuclease
LAESDPSLLDNQERSVLDALRDCLRDLRFDQADLIVSFVMRSGLTLIGDDLQEALERGVQIRLLTTDYLQTTEPDALARLLDLAEDASGRLEVRVFSDETTSFHPKGYLFRSSTTGTCRSLVGSSNLSRSGISLGIEWLVWQPPSNGPGQTVETSPSLTSGCAFTDCVFWCRQPPSHQLSFQKNGRNRQLVLLHDRSRWRRSKRSH